MVYRFDSRYSEMSQQEVAILMNERWASLCVFTLSVWPVLTVVLTVQVRLKLHNMTVTVCKGTALEKKISEKGRRDTCFSPKIWRFQGLGFQREYSLSDFSVLSFPRNLLDKDTFSKSDPCKYKILSFSRCRIFWRLWIYMSIYHCWE